MIQISASKRSSKSVDLCVDRFLEMNEMEIFGESVIDQAPESGFSSGILCQDEPSVRGVDDLVGVHARAREVPNAAQQPFSKNKFHFLVKKRLNFNLLINKLTITFASTLFIIWRQNAKSWSFCIRTFFPKIMQFLHSFRCFSHLHLI